ncbi:unnamed protein product [Nyctereutes procyonoides]|uniref:(raccoon dog) hypothetical protein n=1 Tax=Nyctereutes procyonoides TaxID=34880 RepID=A0A811ZY23_NYCPR|nr:unnamed protein product [Nyctereutes procyonoides]
MQVKSTQAEKEPLSPASASALTSTNPCKPVDDETLFIYSHYKQATWDAWNQLKETSNEDAMEADINKAEVLYKKYGI